MIRHMPGRTGTSRPIRHALERASMRGSDNDSIHPVSMHKGKAIRRTRTAYSRSVEPTPSLPSMHLQHKQAKTGGQQCNACTDVHTCIPALAMSTPPLPVTPHTISACRGGLNVSASHRSVWCGRGGSNCVNCEKQKRGMDAMIGNKSASSTG